jgi:L-proline---[L-prolyl-carrier protein] ligase
MLLQAIRHHGQQQPSALALQDGEQQLSYGNLIVRTEQIATQLIARGVQTGQIIAIAIDRGIDATCALFGCLRVGCAYLPLDLKNPPLRLNFILDDSHATLILGCGPAPAWITEPERWLDITATPGTEKTITSQDYWPADTLASILYTSGSTGQPRGVAISHGAIAAFSNWASNLVALTATDRIASSAPFFFDLSTFDLYGVLSRGASLHFLPSALTLSPARLSIWLHEHIISGWYTVPSLLAFLTYKGNLSNTPLPVLRFLMFAGEAFAPPALHKLANLLPHTNLYNLYGPTETNVCCYWPVEQDKLDAATAIPIGQPAANCLLHINSEGELCVQGPTLASGYWQQGQLTPFRDIDNWYPTGDRASFDGHHYHFHGRLNRMLKCAGYRVEPAEIESAASTLPGVEAAVVGLDNPIIGQQLALALSLDGQTGVNAVRKMLQQRLPAYMQPKHCMVLPALPRLSNGKIDYQQIAQYFQAEVADP